MGDSVEGDAIRNIERTEEKVSLTEETMEESIFQNLHKQYLQIATLDNKEKTDDHDRTVLESMIAKIKINLGKIDKKHTHFMRFMGMQVFLHHLLAKFKEECEAVNLLENIYKEAKPYFVSPEVAYSGFLIMNSLSNYIQKRNSLERIKEILEECQSVYNMLKASNKEENYFAGNELFSPQINMESNKEARLKFEKIVITNLLFLGSVYEKLGNHYKDIVCYHTAFSRMLNKGLVSPFKWVDFTTRLACVFIDDNNFKDARHHLSAATHVNEILDGKYKKSDDNAIKELLKNNAIHLALAWVRYCVLLFEKSKDEDRTKFLILYKSGYFFPGGKTSSFKKPNLKDIPQERILTSERNIVFRNQRFIDTIDKELVEDENDKFDEYNDIIKEESIGFGDILSGMGESSNILEEEIQNNLVDLSNSKNSSNTNVETATNIGLSKSKNSSNTDLEMSTNPKDKEDKDTKLKKNTPKEEMEESVKVNDTVKGVGTETKSVKSKTEKSSNEDGQEMKLVFSSLGYLPIEHTVTKDLIQNPEAAKKLFSFACGWSKQAQAFYPRNTDFYSHVHVMLNMVSLYRLCAYFQGRDNLEYRISLEQTRESLLEQLVLELTEIQPESHLHVRLYQEMALLNIDLAMLNMCNIYNISADDTYKLCALAEIQSHINHTYIVGDMLEKSTEILDEEKSVVEMCKEDIEEETENVEVK